MPAGTRRGRSRGRPSGSPPRFGRRRGGGLPRRRARIPGGPKRRESPNYSSRCTLLRCPAARGVLLGVRTASRILVVMVRALPRMPTYPFTARSYQSRRPPFPADRLPESSPSATGSSAHAASCAAPPPSAAAYAPRAPRIPAHTPPAAPTGLPPPAGRRSASADEWLPGAGWNRTGALAQRDHDVEALAEQDAHILGVLPRALDANRRQRRNRQWTNPGRDDPGAMGKELAWTAVAEHGLGKLRAEIVVPAEEENTHGPQI